MEILFFWKNPDTIPDTTPVIHLSLHLVVERGKFLGELHLLVYSCWIRVTSDCVETGSQSVYRVVVLIISGDDADFQSD